MSKRPIFRWITAFVGLILLSNTLTAQLLRGVLACEKAFGEKLYLKQLHSNDLLLLDSCTVALNGNFCFPLPYHTLGFYTLGLNDTNSIELILNPAELEVELYFSDIHLKEGLVVLKSVENQLLWTNKLLSKSVINQKRQLYVQRSWLTTGDAVSRDSLTHKIAYYDSVQIAFVKTIAKQYPSTFFAKTALLSLPHKGLSKEIYFEDIDFNDTTLLRSPVLQIRILEFLLAYTSYTEPGFRESIDHLLAAAKTNETVWGFCLNYLLELFDHLGPEAIFQYLVESYVLGDACAEENANAHFKAKTASYKLLLPGNKTLTFSAPNEFGKQLCLDSLIHCNDYVLLFFWSSVCDFCKAQLPLLKAWYAVLKEHKIEVLGISLDPDKMLWQGFVEGENLPWLNVIANESWASDIARKYKVNKTPTFYLVSSKSVIIARPNEVSSLAKLFPFLPYPN